MRHLSSFGKLPVGFVQHRPLFSIGLAVRVAMVHVLAVGTRVGEALQTFETLEGLFSAVETFVLRQMVLVLEGLGALVTLVWSLT